MNDQEKIDKTASERRLVSIIQTADNESDAYAAARSAIIDQNMGLIEHSVWLRLRSADIEHKEDVIQECCILFLKVIEDYDLSSAGSPVAYAIGAIRIHIPEFVIKAKEIVSIPMGFHWKSSPYRNSWQVNNMRFVGSLDAPIKVGQDGESTLKDMIAGADPESEKIPLVEIKRIIHNAVSSSKKLTIKHKVAIFEYFAGKITQLSAVLKYAIKILRSDTETKEYITMSMRNYYA